MYHAAAIAIIALPLADMLFCPKLAWRKVGGLTFIRLGRLQASFCITRN